MLFTAKQSTPKVEKKATSHKDTSATSQKNIDDLAWEMYKSEQKNSDKKMSVKEKMEGWATCTDDEKEVQLFFVNFFFCLTLVIVNLGL